MWGKIHLSNVNEQTQVYNKKYRRKPRNNYKRLFYKPGFKQSPLISQLHFKLPKHVKPRFLWLHSYVMKVGQ